MKSDITVELTNRQVIENKLLTALNNADCVAILASEEDLRVMIGALLNLPFDSKARKMAEDYTMLLKYAFPRHKST